jgi:hypothetical protein
VSERLRLRRASSMRSALTIGPIDSSWGLTRISNRPVRYKLTEFDHSVSCHFAERWPFVIILVILGAFATAALANLGGGSTINADGA